MLRCLVAVAVVISGVALPACAQRGGSHGGFAGRGGGFSRGGGFASRGAPASHGNFASTGRVGASSFFRSSGPVSTASRYSTGTFARSSRSLWRGGEPGGYNRRDGFRAPYRDRRSYASGYGIYGLGWGGSDLLAYPDYFGDDEPYNDSTQAAAPSPPAYPAGDVEASPEQQFGPVPNESFRPEYQRPAPTRAVEPAPEDEITLVFKDGRAPEKIQNYLLTRTTLYVQGARLRQIAVADIDLAATQKLNRDVGIDFQLPSGR